MPSNMLLQLSAANGSAKRTGPALVVPPGAYNGKVGLALLCPVTGHVTGYPFEVQIPADLRITGVVLSDQVKSLEWRARDAEFICKLPRSATVEVLEKLGTLISLGEV